MPVAARLIHTLWFDCVHILDRAVMSRARAMRRLSGSAADALSAGSRFPDPFHFSPPAAQIRLAIDSREAPVRPSGWRLRRVKREKSRAGWRQVMKEFLFRTASAAVAGLIAGYAAAVAGAVFEREAGAIPYGEYALPAGIFLFLVFILHGFFGLVAGTRLRATPPPTSASADPLTDPAAGVPPATRLKSNIAEIENAAPEAPGSSDDREARRVAQLYAVIQATQEGRTLDAHLQQILAKLNAVQEYRAAHARAGKPETEDYRRTIDALLREIMADFRSFENKDPLNEFLYDMGGFHIVGLLAEFGMNNIAYGLYRNMKDDHLKSRIRQRHPDIFSR